MSRVRARKSGGVTVTLSSRLATRLRVEEGGYLDIEEVKGGVLLKPLSPDDRRKVALQGIHAVQARASARIKRLSAEAQEKAIARMLAEDDE